MKSLFLNWPHGDSTGRSCSVGLDQYKISAVLKEKRRVDCRKAGDSAKQLFLVIFGNGQL